MIHGCSRGMLAGLCLFWLGVSGWAVAQSASVAPPTEALSHQLLEKVQHDIALVEPWLDRYGYGAVFVAVGRIFPQPAGAIWLQVFVYI